MAARTAKTSWDLSWNEWEYICFPVSSLSDWKFDLLVPSQSLCFLLENAQKLIATGEMHGGDNPYSLFEGIGGMAYLFLDMIDPTAARFAAYELWTSGQENFSFAHISLSI